MSSKRGTGEEEGEREIQLPQQGGRKKATGILHSHCSPAEKGRTPVKRDE